MDCSFQATRFPGLWLVSTTDFFYPLIEDPYLQGRIACANVLSDLYSCGITRCDSLLMLIAASTDMPEPSRFLVTREIMRGFNDCAKEAGTSVSGGQSVMNPWPIIGGVASTLCAETDFIRPEKLAVGDLLVLTKPLGIQLAVNCHQWLSSPEKWARTKDVITRDDARAAYQRAITSMTTINRPAAVLMHQFGAHGATDVTGFGILGHADNLAKHQPIPLNIHLHTFPVIRSMAAVDSVFPNFNLRKGRAAETSGGLLVAFPPETAQKFMDQLKAETGMPSWIIGTVTASNSSDRKENRAILDDNLKIIDVE